MAERSPLDLLDDLRTRATAEALSLEQVIGELERIKATLWARLVTPVASGQVRVEDRLLGIKEAALRMGMSQDWLYRHAKNLQFMKRIGRKVLFSEVGLTRWLASRGR